MFTKVPRAHGKGNYWRINPDYHDLLEDDDFLVHCNNGNSHFAKLRAASKVKGGSYGRKRAHSHSEGTHDRRDKRIRRRKTESEAKTGPTEFCEDLDWSSLLGGQRMGSQCLKLSHIGSPDLSQVGEPVLCSPLVLPTTMAAVPVELPATPSVTESHGTLLEEVVLKQDSPSPQVLLPWAESNSQSPNTSASQIHPWAESKESTMHEIRNLIRRSKSLGNGHAGPMSPDHSWSSSSTNVGIMCRTPLLQGTSIY